MRVHLYAICWNERPILDFFFRHYAPWVERFHISDDGSDDGTREYLAARPDVVLSDFERSDPDSLVASQLEHDDHAWKASRGEADWVLIADLDEFVHHPDMPGCLERLARKGVTAAPSLGYQMVTRDFPPGEADLARDCVRGVPFPAMSKLALFRPDAIEETNFSPGRHKARPSGRVRWPRRDEILNLHYKHLGEPYVLARHAALAGRRADGDRARNWGWHWEREEEEIRAVTRRLEAEAADIRGVNPHRAHRGLRWWRPGGGPLEHRVRRRLRRMSGGLGLGLHEEWARALNRASPG